MAQYAFKADGAFQVRNLAEANPQIVGEALEAVAVANNGVLHPAEIVKAATPKTAPLHPHFDWENRIAANHWRLHQARQLIGVIRIVDERPDARPDQMLRAYISVNAGATDGGYHRVGDVMTNRSLQDLVLAQAERELESFQRRYRDLLDVCRLVREAQELVRQRISERPPRQRPERPSRRSPERPQAGA